MKKLMSKLVTPNRFTRYFLSPILSVVAVGIIDALSRFGWYTPSLVLAFFAFVIGSYWSGIRANLVAALIISAYAFISPGFAFDRAVSVSVTIISLAIYLRAERRRLIASVEREMALRYEAKAVQVRIDELADLSNGVQHIIAKQRDSQAMLLGLLANTNPNDPNQPIVRSVIHTLAEAELLTRGWYTLDKILKGMKTDGGGNE